MFSFCAYDWGLSIQDGLSGMGGVGFEVFSQFFIGACVGIHNPLIESLKVVTTVQASTNDQHILVMRKFWSVGSNNPLMKQLINLSFHILSLRLH